MSRARFEIVTTDDGAHARTIAGNNQIVFTSELYTGPSARRSARRALATLVRLAHPGSTVEWHGHEAITVAGIRGSRYGFLRLPVRYVDERGA